jgi:phytoene dehydrogenase-like protein
MLLSLIHVEEAPVPVVEANPRVVVIGSGIGGTASTLLLSHVGLPVTLLEKNTQLGGACAGYEKQGFHIDFSTHTFSRGSKGPLGEVLRRTGHDGAIEFLRTHNIAEFRYPARDGSGRVERVPFPSQAHRWPIMAIGLAKAMGLGPRDMIAGARLITDLMTMSDATIATWTDRSVPDYTAQFSHNPRLVGALNYLLTLFFVIAPVDTSAGEAIYCFQRMMRDNALSYPRGGSKTIPTTYCRLARDNGAQIRTRAGASKILIEDGTVRGVRLEDGSVIAADIVISTSSVRTTALQLCDPGSLPPDYLDAARNIKGSLSGVQLKIALNKRCVDAGILFGGHGHGRDLFNVEHDDFPHVFQQLSQGRLPDQMGFYCPVTTNFDPALAPPGHQLLTFLIGAPATDVELHDAAPLWEEAALNTVREIVPDLDEHIVFVDRTTTHWMEHWLGKTYGPAISTAQTPAQVGANRPSVSTPVRGLYLAGDGAGGRGIGTELAADSAMECAEHILTDLGRPIPTTWRTNRYQQPRLSHLLWNTLRPTSVTAR